MRTSHRASGFTLIEMMISATLLTVVLGGLALAMRGGFGLFSRVSRESDLNARGGRALNRAVSELRGTGQGSFEQDLTTPLGMPKVWSTTLDFRIATGWDGTSLLWGAERRIDVELAPGEIDNDLDDNGDGRIDERRLVFVLDPDLPTEMRVVLINGVSELLEGELPNGVDDNGNELVDEHGFCLDLDGDALTLRLSIETTDKHGELIVRTLTDTLLLRN